MTPADLAAFLGRVGEVRERCEKACTGPSEYLDAECLELLVTAARLDLPAALDAVEALVGLLGEAQAELMKLHWEFQHDYEKDEAKCDKCQFRARISQALGR